MTWFSWNDAWLTLILCRNSKNAKTVWVLLLVHSWISQTCQKTPQLYFLLFRFSKVSASCFFGSTIFFQITVAETPAASIKVDRMSWTSAPLWRSCWAQGDSKTSVSTPSKCKNWKFERLLQTRTIFFVRYWVIPVKYLFVHKSFKQVTMIVGFHWAELFGKSWFVFVNVVKCLLCTEPESREKC